MSDPGGSDQASFLAVGVPAVQLFTGANPDYHAASDIADKIDGKGLLKVAAVAREFAAYLAERDRPLTTKLATTAGSGITPPASGERRVTLGTIPDYAFAGPGVRISGTTPGSPAEKAGLKEGDVLVKIGDAAIGGMKDFSEALKRFDAGARVSVAFLRDGAPMTVEAVLAAR
jgi:S1-C subfamily serine protease